MVEIASPINYFCAIDITCFYSIQKICLDIEPTIYFISDLCINL